MRFRLPWALVALPLACGGAETPPEPPSSPPEAALRASPDLESQVGVTRLHGAALLRMIDKEYIEPPDRSALIAGAHRRLHSVLLRRGLTAELPGLQPMRSAPELVAAFDALVDAGLAAGLDESLVVVELVLGAMDSLDPWTVPVWPAELTGWQSHHAGVSMGVGLGLRLDSGAVVVEGLAPDSPAFLGGVHLGDRVLKLRSGGQTIEVSALAASERVATVQPLIAGPPGSVLSLDLLRGEHVYGVDLVRGPIPEILVTGLRRDHTNQWQHWLDESAGLAYFRLEAFRSQSDELLRTRLNGMARPRGVVLDLRGNGGGDVAAAVNVADLFVAEGDLAHMVGRGALEPPPPYDERGVRIIPWNRAMPGDPLEGLPVVVLVDADTASAAEITAGALQERASATVIGDRTLGKGLSQGLVTDPVGVAAQITNAAWTLPSGRSLHGAEGGIEPDIALPLSAQDRLRLGLLYHRAHALRAHADGSPMPYSPPIPVDELAPLAHDAALLRAEAVLRKALEPQ